MIEGVIVTGGAGYIGSATVDLLAQQPSIRKIAVIDDLSSGHRAAVHSRATFFQGDLAHSTAAADALQWMLNSTDPINPERVAVVHFAALISVPDSQSNPLRYWKHNVAMPLGFIEKLSAHGVRRFVFSSTAAVYGVPEGTLNEGHSTLPINTYGLTKLTVERALQSMAAPESGVRLRAIALRYFNACGAVDCSPSHGSMKMLGEDHFPETHMIPNAMKAALNGSPFTLYGTDYPTEDGTCVRDYIHIGDLASAHVAAIQALGSPTDAHGYFEEFNVGCGVGSSNLQIIRAIEEITGRKIAIEVKSRRAGDSPRLVASAEKITQKLGWRPQKSSIHEIITSVHRWMTHYPKGYGDRE